LLLPDKLTGDKISGLERLLFQLSLKIRKSFLAAGFKTNTTGFAVFKQPGNNLLNGLHYQPAKVIFGDTNYYTNYTS
jgi:hypothetical protein